MILLVQTLLSRFDNSAANRELIIRGAENSRQDEIFLCFYCYQNPDSDYYNLAAKVNISLCLQLFAEHSFYQMR